MVGEVAQQKSSVPCYQPRPTPDLAAATPQAGDCVAFKTAPAFVDSVWEVFGPLLAGVPLVAVPRAVGRDPGQVGGVVECLSWANCRPSCVLC